MIKCKTTFNSRLFNFPVLMAIVYLVGYSTISGYLSKYHIVSIDLLNIQYIKAGLSFLLVILPSHLIIYFGYEKPTDNFSISKQEYPKLFGYMMVYVIILDTIIFHFPHRTIKSFLLLGSFFTFFCITFIYTSYAKRHVSNTKKALLFFGTSTFVIICFATINFYSLLLFIMVFSMAASLIVQLGLINDGKLDFSIFIYPISFLLFSSLYGLCIYQYMPSYLGGIEQNKITFFLKENSVFRQNAKIVKMIGTYIFEDKDFFYIKNMDNITVGITKNSVGATEMEIEQN